MTCDPSQTISAADIAILKGDIETIDTVVESTLLTTTTPRGKAIDTLTGRLSQLGYLPPVVYGAGISFSVSDNVKTIDRDGIIYAPIPSELPFDTTGTWGADDELKFFTVQSVSLYSGQLVIPYDSVAGMGSDAQLQVGILAVTEGYFGPGDNGGGLYTIVPAGTGTHDGGRFIDLGASGLQAQALFPLGRFFAAQFGVVGVGDESAAMQSAINAASVYGGSTILLAIPESGQYTFNVIVGNEITLEGTSRQVLVAPATDKPTIELDPTIDIDQFTARNLTLDGVATKGSFVTQDAILSAPVVGVVHKGINLHSVRITDSGKRGLALVGQATTGETGRVAQVALAGTVIENNVGPGVYFKGNTGVFTAVGGAISNNGDESVDLLSNIVAEPDGVGFPEALSFQSVAFDTSLYTVQGNTFYLTGVLSVDIGGCLFTELFTGLNIGPGPNGQISVRDCRFDRPLGPILSLAEVQAVNGFVWDNNDVDAFTTGPVGIKLTGAATDLIKLDVRSNNSWGALDVSTDEYPPAVLAVDQISLPRRSGTIPITLAADGTADLVNLFDEKGGVAQLVSGDMVTLYTSALARTVTVKSSTGNIRLAGNADMPLDDVRNTLTLVYNQGFDDWVEISRSINHA